LDLRTHRLLEYAAGASSLAALTACSCLPASFQCSGLSSPSQLHCKRPLKTDLTIPGIPLQFQIEIVRRAYLPCKVQYRKCGQFAWNCVVGKHCGSASPMFHLQSMLSFRGTVRFKTRFNALGMLSTLSHKPARYSDSDSVCGVREPIRLALHLAVASACTMNSISRIHTAAELQH